MHHFKLLAIRPLPDCNPQILKILQPDQFYFFDNTYTPNRDHLWIHRRDTGHDYIPEDFFFRKTNAQGTLKSINVQALVGKNGEGKSSLTDLALRIFNNFFKAKTVHPVTEQLLFVQRLFAEVYFLSDEKIYRIRTWVHGDGTVDAVLEFSDVQGIVQQEERTEMLRKLFFVINVNYSHYSLNSLDFIKETAQTKKKDDHTWLDSVFHRNDGYQTPLTVHPFRKQGIIDVNTERDLTNQRLLTLILTEPSYEIINADLTVEEIIFEKFDKNPIQNLLHEFSKKYVEDEQTDPTKERINGYNKDLISDETENHFLISEMDVFLISWKTPIEERPDAMEQIPDHEDEFKFLPGDKPVERTEQFLAWLNDDGVEEIMKLSIMCQTMTELLPRVNMADMLQNTLFKYLCVKAYKMLRYPQYKHIEDLIKKRNYRHAVDAYITQIKEEGSHVAIKFNQAFYLFDLIQQSPESKLIKCYRAILNSKKRLYSVALAKLKTYIAEVLERPGNKIPKIYLNPPGIFKKSIMLKAAGSQGQIELSGISSGEYQKIGMLSSIIYHLTNIDSIQSGRDGAANQYRHLLLILDEIELYFHPDFQRTLLNELLKRISQVNFRKIEAINILFVTHSPFVLSDVPSANVMFIENGLQTYPMSENTFGGNIHTLLQHGFFLKGMPVGEFAKDKINQLFDILNQQLDLNETPDLEKRILMVSEPFLRSQLLKLFHDRRYPKDLEALLKRISDLENKIKND